MASITARKRADGIKYTAQIRLKKDGKVYLTEAKTFDRKAQAKAWGEKREAELRTQGGGATAFGATTTGSTAGITLGAVIERYLAEHHLFGELGKTKGQTLRRIAASDLGRVAARDVGSAHLVAFGRDRLLNDGIKPQTLGNDLAHLSAVFRVAKAGWGFPLDYAQIAEATTVLRKMNMVRRSAERDRRPTLAELDKLMSHFSAMQKRKPTSINMPRVLMFALFSSRRDAEVCRITWGDLVLGRQAVVVRDMKNPGQTLGNDVECHLPDRAWQILQAMPRVEGVDRIFPYHPSSVSTAFTKACKVLGIEDLKLHDLRHECISHLFELDWQIPRVASVSGHTSWNSLRRYTKLEAMGDKYAESDLLDRALACEVNLGARISQWGKRHTAGRIR
jgi:integrase